MAVHTKPDSKKKSLTVAKAVKKAGKEKEKSKLKNVKKDEKKKSSKTKDRAEKTKNKDDVKRSKKSGKEQEKEAQRKKTSSSMRKLEEAGVKKKAKVEEKEPQKEAVYAPPVRRHTGKSKPGSSPTSEGLRTPPTRQALCPSVESTGASSAASKTSLAESLDQWKREAKKRGLSLEEFMEEESERDLEARLQERMKELVDQQNNDNEAKVAKLSQKSTLNKKALDEHDAAKGKQIERELETELQKVEEAQGDSSSEEGEMDDSSDDEAEESEAESKKEEGEEDESSGEDQEEEEEEEEEEDDEEEADEELEAEDTSLLESVGLLASDGEEEKAEKAKTQTKEADTGKSNKADTSKSNKANAEKNKNQEAEKKAGSEEKTPIEAVVAEQKKATAGKFANANSKTHKSEWDKFNRQLLNRKTFPQNLAQHVLKDKLDVFRSWLDAGGEWEKVQAEFQKKAEKSVLSRKQRQGLKFRDILQRYSKTKAEALVKSLKERNLFYYDSEFPNDEEEIYYYVGCGDIIRSDDKTKESTAVTIKDSGNHELTDALISGEGPLANGFQPGVRTNNEAGQKELLESLDEATKVEKKKPKKEKKEKTEKAEPTTLDELAGAQMDEALKKGAEARKNAIALSSLEYSGDLPQQLLSFSAKMEAVYKCLQQLRDSKSQNPKAYEKHFNIIKEKLAWYEKAEAAASALKKGLNAKPKKKAKAKKPAKNDDGEAKESAAKDEGQTTA